MSQPTRKPASIAPAAESETPPRREPLRALPRPARLGGRFYDVPPFGSGLRLDAFLTRLVGERSRAEWQRLIELGVVLVNERRAKPSTRVYTGDRVRVADTPAHLEVRPQADIPLEVVYQDEDMVVVNKPAGLVVHPAPGHEQGTLVNALLARFPELQDPTGTLRPGIVHRLDKDTSGLLVVGRTAQAVANLQAQFKHRVADKRYLVLVCGNLSEDQGLVDAPIARDAFNRQRMSVRGDGRAAQTEFTVRERFGSHTLVEARIHTGRTHQLRVHFAYIGHPVAGDPVYGRCKAPGLARQFIHAWRLGLRSLRDGRWLEFTADLPDDLQQVLRRLRGSPVTP